ncbi:vacuolar protein sorting-associated protein 11 homolog isoform X2 [Neodiprion pinetum]|uniref:vacuolar protein sorting-associated protein 11 homolog isoform X2 n=1 Tax=Neodiprion pinetum TaxID=441929 RepID=UPI001EDDC3AA|nr:vacuolar protein sorting-associated protein 11 homolog isoform X3 [Neodiprion pinetum]
MMAFLEWRRFNFFDLKKEVDSGKISEALGEAQVTAATSGNGDLVFGDNTGNVHLVNRKYVITTFRAYEITLTLAQQVQHSTFLFTIGEDEPGCNPTIKVWNLAKLDKHGNPTCVRISRAVPGYRAVPASALCVHSGLTLMAVGFGDGSIMLYRGDLTRERKNKIRILKDSNTPVTGLAIRSTGKQTHMFVATTTSVFLYNITVKDKEYKTSLDNMGCSRKCSVLADSTQGSHFMIGRNDAVYCYTPDGRGPCYAVDGQKIMLEWFRSYLVIIAKEAANVPRTTTICAKPNTIEPIPPGADKHTITVLDIQNKVIVFSAPMLSVQAVLSEWGGFFILSGNSKLYHLDEKDLQSKLTLLFKKNLYDVSIRIAKSQQYDAEGLVDIFRQYGDHLYSKGDHNGAIEQYIKTIGKLEPSYVIRKFLDSQHIDNLTTYLQALHKQGQATGDHTTLLLNCYTKLNHTEKLKEFIMTKDREVDFDVEIAIKVCRQASSEDALLLATKHGKHEWYLRIQIEDKAEYKGALEYIATLDFEEAESNMKKYGSVLIEHVPNEATQFLKRLCTNYRPANKPLVDQATLDGSVEQSIEKANPEEFIHLFLGNSERLVEFLEHLVKCESNCFQSFSENENECPACLPNNKKLLDIIKAQEQSRDLHETFHSLLDRAEDPFSLVADYFGRGVFKKLTVITDADKPQALPSSKFQEPKPKFQEPKPNYYAYGAGAEAKLRLGEGRNTNLVTLEPRYVGSDTPSNVVIPIPEGRLRVLAKPDIYSSSFDTSLSGPTSGTSTPRSSRKGSPIPIREARILNISSPKMSPAQKTFIPPKTPIVPLNPFTGDGYDESKNPFAEDNNTVEDDPFQEDDDYDKNLNPFAS